MADIRETGYQTYKDLQEQNNAAFNPETATNDDWYKYLTSRKISDYGDAPSEYVGLQAAQAGYGNSQHDDAVTSASQFQDLNDIRYAEQPWYDTLANGLGKALGTAGTTFVSSLVGLPYGLVQAGVQGRWSALWDNDVTQALSDADDWLEENLTNYRSTQQQQNPWWSKDNLFSMNFIADDVIKNMGFTLGAAASMAVGSGSLGLLSKSLGIVNDVSKGSKMANAAAAALFSATGEGMIEARQGVEERNKLEQQKLNDALAPEYNELQAEQEAINQRYALTGDYQTYKAQLDDWSARKNTLDERKAAGEQQIEESGREMGNKILLGNQILLTAGNMIQFGKAMTKSFDNARHAAEITSKSAKPFGVRAVKAGKDFADGYVLKGKGWGRLSAATKGLLTEGSEEMNQQFIQSAAGAAYTEEDVNDYWKAKLDPEAYRETTKGLYTLGNILDRGFNESWGDANQWEQFVIGGLTGMSGSYSPTKLFNQDKTKSRLDPRRYGSWEGGAIREVGDFNKAYNQYSENIDELNKVLAQEDFGSRTQNLIAHTYLEGNKEYAAANNDKKTWKDEDDKQAIHDIQAFLRAGKLDDLRAIYDEMGKDLSDEDIESIVKSTTKEETIEGKTTYSGPFFDDKGNKVKTNDEIREEIKHNSDELNRKLNSYLDSIDYINRRTGGQLSKDQEDNLAYLHNMSSESLTRADKIMSNVRKSLPNKFLLKTQKSPEQLTRENASSDLAFSKDENTKDGYVEVDTSLMNDAAFTDFFIRNVIWGGNIRTEFGETADEKAAREQSEEGLSEDEKKEKRSAKEKAAREKAQSDAQEQNATNLELIAESFRENFKTNERGNQSEEDAALSSLFKDMADAAALVSQAGMYAKTLDEYLANPEKVEQDKQKEENKTEKKKAEQRAKDTFSGKTAKDINQAVANGDISAIDIDDFIGADLSDVTDADSKTALQTAQQEAQKSRDIRQKQAGLKNAVLTAAEHNGVNDASIDIALQAIDNMAANAEDMSDISLDNLPDYVSEEDLTAANNTLENPADLAQQVANIMSEGMNIWQEGEDKKNDIPSASTAVSFAEPEDTGHDATTKVPAETAVPKVVSQEGNEYEQPIPVNTLTPEAINTIIENLRKASEEPAKNGTWRSTTRRYGRQKGQSGKYYMSQVPYHELLSDKKSIKYKRSKAIWNYLNSENAWEKVDNAENDRLKAGDGIHFMVKNFASEIFDKDFETLKDEDKPYALVILMLNDTGEVLGDLPLAQYEPSYGAPNETQQVKELKSTQDKLFKAFEDKRGQTGCNEAIADKTLQKEGAENLNLTFDNRTKSPFMSEISQVLNGTVPFGKEINTLNDVMGDKDLLLGISVTSSTIATSRDKSNKQGGKALPIQTGNVGQSYILIPSASGALVPIPFYTKAFNAAAHQETALYRMLLNSMSSMVQDAINKKNNTISLRDNLDVLQGLLQVRPDEQSGNVIASTKDSISLHLQSLTDANNKIDIEVSNSGNATDIARELLSQLSGTPINISLQYLNGTIGTSNGLSAPYNRVIGEIADVNLPKNTNHTVNNWFTVKLSTQAGLKRNEVRYKQSGIQQVDINGRTVEIDTDKFEAYEINPTTKERTLITGDNDVNLALAEVKAAQQADPTKPFKISLDGEVKTYDPVEKKFVKSSQGVGVNAGQPSINQQKQERKEKAIQDINDELKANKTINKSNQDAWDAIPNALKLKMVNERVRIILDYGTKKVSVDYRNLDDLKKKLAEANNYAKSGTLKVSEGAKYRIATEQESKADIQKERKWLQKNLPMFNEQERFNLINGLIEMPDEKNWAWGRFEKGVITLSDMSAAGTLYHEAFHAVTQTLLSDEELDNLYNAAVKHYKEQDVALVEELLAEDFRRYVQRGETPIVGPILKFFRRILNAMRNLVNYRAPIAELFYRINNGEFQNSIPRESRSGNAFYRFVSKYQLPTNSDDYKRIKDSMRYWELKSPYPYKAKESRVSFIGYWKGKGFTPILTDSNKLVRIIPNKYMDSYRAEKESPETKTQYQARQAYEGRKELIKWDRLSAEQQMNLMDAGLNDDLYNKMSLAEEEQWLNCRG